MSHAQIIAWRPLGELLVERGLLATDELETALTEQVETGERLGAILVRRKAITSVALTTILAEQAGVELETQGGFGSGLFSKIAERHCPDDEPAGQRVAQPARLPSDAEEDRPLSDAAAALDDPAYELSALRAEVEMLRARNAKLETEIAARARRRRSSKSAV